MKFSVAFALLPLIGSAYAAPASSNSIAQRDGKDYDKSRRDDGKDYDRVQDKAHYPDNLDSYPNKHCDVRYQNFLDLLLDDVCAKFYEGDRKHDDRKYADDKKHRRDGKDYHRDDGKKDDGKGKDDGRDDHKEVKECDDRADKLLEEACRTYYHYQPKDDGKKDHGKDDKYNDGKKEDHKHDDGKKDHGRDGKYDDKKDGDKKDGERRH